MKPSTLRHARETVDEIKLLIIHVAGLLFLGIAVLKLVAEEVARLFR